MTSHEYTNLMFSPDDFAHLKIPLENILSATNNFSTYICGKDAFETYYEGKLLWSGELINIYAGRLNKERPFDGDQQFWTEVSMLSSLKHKNLVSFVGFCDDNDEKVTIIKRETRESLICHLSDPMSLTWVRRLEISIGIAQALSYIHYDESRDFSVIHRSIESSLIYLNDDWEPKLGDFIHSMKIRASERHNSFGTDKVWGTDGYMDPTYIETKSVNHKSDMYSFGIVMFELLCGRRSVIANDYNKYLAPLAITHYREKKLDEIIDWGLRQQLDSQSLNVFAEIAYDCLKEERSQRPNIDEIVPRLVKALELARENMPIMSSLQDELAHLKIPLESIRSATNNFDEENIFSTSSFCKEYKGQLLWSGELINIIARRLNKKKRKQIEQEFWMEISMLSSLKHKNLVSILGFCDENDEKIIIYKNETARGMLSKYLSDPMLLTWVRRLEICVSISHALSYIHYDEPRDFSVIHRNIYSATVLLDDDWEPKLSDFECSMKIEASQRHHSFHTDTLECTNGYGDPTYIDTKSVNHKSDMYSFGIVLCELLCGRRSIISDDINKYLAPLAIKHYREKTLNEIIDFDLWQQMDSQSLNIFAEIAYDCLNEERSQRPTIDEIVTRLEKALELQLEHQNAIMSSPKDDLAHLQIPLENILSATNNFAEQNFICSTYGYCKEYKGQLLWSGDMIDIKARRLNKERDEQKFWMEISMLSTLKHKNLVSLVGFCDENDEKIIINKNETRGRLDNYLSDPMRLTWVRRLEICVGLGQAWSYIHYHEPRDFSVIHRNITSATVVLNDGWKPKLCDFEQSMRIETSQRHHSFLTYKIEHVNGYGDPTYIETRSVNHKTDMYSFGIVMFELLCGRKSIIGYTDDNHLVPLAITHYREKKLDNIIDSELWRQIDLHSFNMFAEIAYECLNEERSQRPNIDEIVPRLKKALELAREKSIHSPPNHLAHLRIPLEDILSATNYFAEKKVIGENGFGKRYKGQLLWSGELIDIIAQRLTNKEWDDEKEQQFWTEIAMLSGLEHKNLVSIIGFCNEVGVETIIYKDMSTGRLEYYLSDPRLLTWVKRLEICVGIANALIYIHYDEPCDFSVIHRNISSYKILLNDDHEPKLSDFEHSIKIKASERNHSFHIDSVWSTEGYTDPRCLKTRRVNHKSDIYSFGIVMFELLCGRKSVSDDQDNKYLAPVAVFHYIEKILDDIIDPDLWKQINPRSLNIFAETAYACLNEEQSQRPNMDQIVTRLEKALELQLECENAVHSSVVDEVGGTSSNHEEVYN